MRDYVSIATCLDLHLCAYVYIIHTHTGTHHWHSFPCGVGWGVIMFSPVQQECLTQVSHIYNMTLFKIKFGHGKHTGTLGCFKGQNSEYHFNLEAFSYESMYKLAINSQQPTGEFSKLLRNLGKRLPSIWSFAFYVLFVSCFLYYYCYYYCCCYSLIISTFKIKPRSLVHMEQCQCACGWHIGLFVCFQSSGL